MINEQKGFTLLEILITVAVMLILSAGGYAVFTNYAKNQSIKVAYSGLYSDLNQARSLSVSQLKPSTFEGSPSTCNSKSLYGYQININTDSAPHSYTLERACVDSANKLFYESLKTVSLPNDVTIVPEEKMILFLLSGEASISAETVSISLSNADRSEYILIDKAGTINAE